MKNKVIISTATFAIVLVSMPWILQHFATLKYARLVKEDQVSAIAAIADYLRDTTIKSERNLNETDQIVEVWEHASISKGPFLRFERKIGIIDTYGNKVSVYRFDKDTHTQIIDSNILSIRGRYQVAVWSNGSNKINEFGRGDDIFSGFTWNDRWEPDPTAITAFLRSRLSSRQEFKQDQ